MLPEIVEQQPRLHHDLPHRRILRARFCSLELFLADPACGYLAKKIRQRVAGRSVDHPVTDYRFTQTLFVWVYFSSASRPWSRPKPDSLNPPNGNAGS